MSPRRAVILSIGEELLDGRIVDTNAPWLAGRLLEAGYEVRAMRTLGDHPGDLQATLAELRGEVEVVISSGGLGPTADDRVRAEAAALLGRPLVGIPDAEEPLRRIWARHHEEPPPDFFLAQGRAPEGAAPLANEVGTAWGFALDLDHDTLFLALPGPPGECRSAWQAAAARLQAHGEAAPVALALLHTAGQPESRIEALVRDRLERTGPVRMGITAEPEGVSLSVLARGADGCPPEEVLEAELELLRGRLGEWCWGRDRQSLAEVVVGALRAAERSVSCAESCTGGLVAGALTSVAGSSAVFERSWVTYADAAKQSELGVPAALLEAHGAVSGPVVEAMAAGARARSGADYALAVSGVAGPGGGSAEKPVGTVWLALAGPDGGYAVERRQYARAGRGAVRRQSVRDALDMLRRALGGLPPLPPRLPRDPA